jgi:soluble lytic murein transglycosylase-like protein
MPTNLRYGCYILRFYLDREDQNWRRALAAYNGSSGSQRYPDMVRSAWQSHWRTAPIDW